MKTSFRIASAIVTIAFCSFSAVSRAQLHQSNLYIDDLHGHFTILQAANGGGTLTFPAGSGTLVTSASSPSDGSLLYANGAGAWTTLLPTSNTYVLTLTSGVPAWQPESGFSLPYSQSFAPGFDAVAFAITNTSNSGIALAAYDDAPTPSESFGLYGYTTYGTAVGAFSTGTGNGLLAQNSGSGANSGEAIYAGNLSGNTQPVIYLNNQGTGFDIRGTGGWTITGDGHFSGTATNATTAAALQLPYSQSFAPGFDAVAFAITNTSNSGIALAAYDDAPTPSESFGLYGYTTYGTAVGAFSTGTGNGLLAQNSGTGANSGEAIYAGNLSGNTQPVIYLNNQGSGYDIQGTGGKWFVDDNGNGTFNSVTTTGNIVLSTESDNAVSGNPSTVTISGNKASVRIEPGTADHNIVASVTATPTNAQLLYLVNNSGFTITLGSATILNNKLGVCIYLNGTWWAQ